MSVTALKWEVRDRLRKAATAVGGQVSCVAAGACGLVGLDSLALRQALLAYRLSFANKSITLIKRQLKKRGLSALRELISSPVSTSEAAQRTLVLCWPQLQPGHCVSKGVLLIKFTTTFSYFHRNVDIDELQRYFHIVLEPSWAGYADPDILLWGACSAPVFVQAAEYRDRAALVSLTDKLIPLSIGSGSWVDHRTFSASGNGERSLDAIYVANTNPIKRVHLFLRALASLKSAGHADYRAALVCASWGGGSADEISQLVDAYGVADLCSIHYSIPQAEVSRLVRQSKACLLLSLKEGSNRSLYEAMFCGTPVIAFAENVGIDKQNINHRTGLLIYEAALPDALLHMRKYWRQFSPREWALSNISPENSTAELLDAISSYTGDVINPANVLIKTNTPEARYRDYPRLRHELYSDQILAIFRKDEKSSPERSSNEQLAELTARFRDETRPLRPVELG